MTLFRMDISKESDTVMLYMESACGFRPLIGWSSVDGMKEFAEMLLATYHHRDREKSRIRETSDNILRQVLDSDPPLWDEKTTG